MLQKSPTIEHYFFNFFCGGGDKVCFPEAVEIYTDSLRAQQL